MSSTLLPGARSVAIALVLVLGACGTDRSESADTSRVSARARVASVVPDAAALDTAARAIVAFLRGQHGFEQIRLADTVTLYLAPEGGGTRVTLSRDGLRRPSDWVIASGTHRYPLAPPASMSRLTTRVGRHFNCLEQALSSRSPALASLPHVGVKLEPEGAGSCLQSWNLTLVFEPGAQPPRLVAALYDQWEW